jgi:leucyl-tRNA synthetase
MSLAPEHPLVEKLTVKDRLDDVRGFVKRVVAERAQTNIEEAEKKGCFTGAYCLNPLTGGKVPVYVANFVLMAYGTGAVMAVPAHDQRDFEFARKYDILVKVVINPPGETLEAASMEAAYVEPGIMTSSGEFDGLKSTDAIPAIISNLEKKGAGKAAVNYKLRDWGISRQRYWGCPIPVLYCSKCGTVPVPLKDLPIILPEDVKFAGGSLSPLATSSTFLEAECPGCGGTARRETDTMDTFVDSSWYFLRYISPAEETLPFDKDEVLSWMPVDQYIGGIEHAVMHLLYARFFTKALRDLGLHTFDEPFKNLLTQGMVCKETHKCPTHGYLLPIEAERGVCSKCGAKVEVGAVEKMSKSKKNIVDPDRLIEKYGADTTRLFSLFAAPPEKDLDFSAEGVEGSYRFLGRVWRLVTENPDLLENTAAYTQADGELTGFLKEVHQTTHRTIKKVTEDIEKRFHFNTAISSIMELVNILYQFRLKGHAEDPAAPKVFREAVEAVVLLLSPFAPHISEELWSRLGGAEQVCRMPWPSYSEDSLVTEEVTIVVQINGKVRSRINAPADAPREEVEALAAKDDKVLEWTKDKSVKKVVYVPNKLLNMVVG